MKYLPQAGMTEHLVHSWGCRLDSVVLWSWRRVEEVCHWGLTAQIALPTSCLLSAYSLWIQCDWLPPTAIAMWPFNQHGLSSMIGYEQ